MTDFTRAEILAAHDRYIGVRNRIEAGELGWDALAEFFTPDATFIDQAWGRIQGREAIVRFLVDSMAGLEDWRFPHEWAMVEGNRLVSGWKNRLPGRRADGSTYDVPGVSILIYAGGGKFSSEHDLYNMAHIYELVAESGWEPNPRVNMPPQRPPR